MVDLAMSIFEILNKFLTFWHPWHPWVCVRSVCWSLVWKWNLKQIEAISPSVHSIQFHFDTSIIKYDFAERSQSRPMA